jgi:tetratricopeptide (TPR) repeat protein
MKQIFVSHGRDELVLARAVAEDLIRDGHSVSLSRDFPIDSAWKQAISASVAKADGYVLLISEKSSEFERFEWGAALQSRWQDEAKPLLPVLLDAEAPAFVVGLPAILAVADTPVEDLCADIRSAVSKASSLTADSHAEEEKMRLLPLPSDDSRSRLIERLDATIGALSEEKPDDEQLAEHRAALEIACSGQTDEKGRALANLNIGLIDLQLRDHYSALTHLNRALEICEEAGVEDYPNRVSILLPLAQAMEELNLYGDAQNALTSAAQIRAGEEGSEAPAVIAINHELGSLLVRAGDYGRAEPLLVETLKANRRALGDSHPRVEANELWLSLAREQLYGSCPQLDLLRARHPIERVMRVLGLGYTLMAVGDLVGARAALNRAVLLAESDDSIKSGFRASCWFYLGVTQLRFGDAEEAIVALAKASEYNVEPGFEEGWVVSRYHLGLAYRAGGDPDAAAEIFERVLADAAEVLGPGHRLLAETLYYLGLIHRDGGQLASAEIRLREAALLGAETFGADDPRVAKYSRALERLRAAA